MRLRLNLDSLKGAKGLRRGCNLREASNDQRVFLGVFEDIVRILILFVEREIDV